MLITVIFIPININILFGILRYLEWFVSKSWQLANPLPHSCFTKSSTSIVEYSLRFMLCSLQVVQAISYMNEIYLIRLSQDAPHHHRVNQEWSSFPVYRARNHHPPDNTMLLLFTILFYFFICQPFVGFWAATFKLMDRLHLWFHITEKGIW